VLDSIGLLMQASPTGFDADLLGLCAPVVLCESEQYSLGVAQFICHLINGRRDIRRRGADAIADRPRSVSRSFPDDGVGRFALQWILNTRSVNWASNDVSAIQST